MVIQDAALEKLVFGGGRMRRDGVCTADVFSLRRVLGFLEPELENKNMNALGDNKS